MLNQALTSNTVDTDNLKPNLVGNYKKALRETHTLQICVHKTEVVLSMCYLPVEK